MDTSPPPLRIGTETTTWSIKDFPTVLRKAILAAAQSQHVNVAEWLTGHFTRYGLDGVEVRPGRQIGQIGQTGQTLPVIPAAPGSSAVADLCRLVDAVVVFAQHREQLPKGLAGTVSRRLRDALRPVPPRTKKGAGGTTTPPLSPLGRSALTHRRS